MQKLYADEGSAIAEKLSVSYTTEQIKIKAKSMGLVEGIAPLIEDLCKNGFYVDETVKAMALKQAGENP